MTKRIISIFSLFILLAYLCYPAYSVLPTIFANQATGNVQASLLDTNFTFLESQGVQGLTTSGSSNSYVATPADAWVAGYSNYVARALTVKPNFTNSGASTINVSGLGAASIYKNASGTQTALASGDMVSGTPAILICDGAGFLLANPTPSASFSPSPITNSLAGDVALNNTSTGFTGPTIAQGSTGNWWITTNVTLVDTSTSANFLVQLWDGSTNIDTTAISSSGANKLVNVALGGYLASPAGNIKVTVTDQSSTSGFIRANASGGGKDSSISAFRIQ